MNLTKISLERAKEIEAASNGAIKFDSVNGSINEVEFPGPFGPLYLKIASYSVDVCETKKKERFVLRQGDQPPVYFDSIEDARYAVDLTNNTISITKELVEV